MAQVTDLENVIADRIWVLLEAQATITAAVLTGARNKGTVQGWLREFINKMPTAQRRLSVEFDRFTHSGYQRRDTFDGESDTFTSASANFDVLRTHRAVIKYSEPLPNDPGVNPIKEAIEQTIFLAGPVLGLPTLVDTVGPITGETRPTRPDEYPQVGRVTLMRFDINTVQSAVVLIAETA